MTVPHSLRIGVLALATTAFYGYVGQLVPQKEVLPPEEVAISSDLTTPEMVTVGRTIMEGKGLCFTCHTMGKSGALRFPDLDGVAGRATTRVDGLSDVEYFAQALYEPDSYIVPGFNPGMPAINKPPIGLTDQEILCVIAYLQSLGGTPTVTLQTTHRYRGAPAGAPAAAPPAGAPAAAPATPAATPAATSTTGAWLAPAASAPTVAVAGAGEAGVWQHAVSALAIFQPLAHRMVARRDGAIAP